MNRRALLLVPLAVCLAAGSAVSAADKSRAVSGRLSPQAELETQVILQNVTAQVVAEGEIPPSTGFTDRASPVEFYATALTAGANLGVNHALDDILFGPNGANGGQLTEMQFGLTGAVTGQIVDVQVRFWDTFAFATPCNRVQVGPTLIIPNVVIPGATFNFNPINITAQNIVIPDDDCAVEIGVYVPGTNTLSPSASIRFKAAPATTGFSDDVICWDGLVAADGVFQGAELAGIGNAATPANFMFRVAGKSALAPAIPANDDCANAVVLDVSTGTATVNGTCVGATVDGSNTCAGALAGVDVYYQFTANSTGPWRIDLCGSTPDWDSTLSLHTDFGAGICPSDITNQLAEAAACSDDDCTLAFSLSRIDNLTLTNGQTYNIRVASFDDVTNGKPFTLTVTDLSTLLPPGNDDCANATPVFVAGLPAAGTTNLATLDPIARPCGLELATSAGVWYSVTGNGTTLTSTTTGPSDTVTIVYKGTCGALQCVGSNDDISGTNLNSTVSWCSEPGVTYLLFVCNAGASSPGPFQIGVAGNAMACTPPVLTTCDVTSAGTTANEADACGTDTNNTCAFGQPIAVGDNIFGQMSATAGVADEDFYTFTVAAPTSVTISFNSESPAVIELVDCSDASTIGLFLSPVCGESELVFDVNLPGSFAINIFALGLEGAPCGSGWNDYTLALSATPTVACCFPTGTCTNVSAGLCALQGGAAGAAASTCSPNPCPQLPGACCQGGGVCTIEADAAACSLLGGSFNGPGSVCDAQSQVLSVFATPIPDNDPLGDTNFINSTDTTLLTGVEFELNIAHTWIGDVTAQVFFTPAAGPNAGFRLGPVDLFNRVGVTTTPQFGAFSELLDTGNYIFSDNAADQDLWVTIGADILNNPAFVDPVPFGRYRASDTIGGFTSFATFLAAGTTAAGTWELFLSDSGGGDVGILNWWKVKVNPGVNPCPVGPVLGSCCETDGTCNETTLAACVTGTWTGGGTCTPNTCPVPMGSCCETNGACQETTQAACAGLWNSGGTCTPNTCPQPENGACCCGSTCVVVPSSACTTGTGTNTSFTLGGVCTPFSISVPCCRGDYNKSGGQPSVQDIFDFLSGYFGNNTCADANDSGGIPSVQDIFDFLAAYFGGC